MCRPVSCKTCGKTTWAGCGQHVDQVMSGIKQQDRCPGHAAEDKSRSGGWLHNLLGR